MYRSDGHNEFLRQVDSAILAFPSLTFIEKEGAPGLKGAIDLLSADGTHLDQYELEIIATERFPKTFPYIFETGGKIPINYDWHVYETDGHCCIKTTPEEMIVCNRGITLVEFIEKEVKPYLFNQTFRRLNGYFYQERSHGIKGWLEYFYEVFGTTDLGIVRSGLSFLVKREKLSRTAICFCGSRKKYRKCHRSTYEALSGLSDNDLTFILGALGIA